VGINDFGDITMSKIPSELKYTESHEWARLEEESNGIVTVGITDHAQGLLGDVVYIELPEIDSEIQIDDEIGVIESVKAASDIFSPVSGTVVEINEALSLSPQLVNSDPYGAGWLFRVEIDDEDELKELLDSKAYEKQVAAEEH
jgi:glycine cleavage system H protein